MARDPDPQVVARLQARFDQFARHAVADDPLYAALTAAAAQRGDWVALLAAAPAAQQLPMLWLAALQDRVMELVAADERPSLAEYYESVGGARAPDPALAGQVDDFIAANRDLLTARMATRSTQTNEIGRCAVLWPVLQSLAAQTGQRRIALLDVGCSAGLNLGVDRWRYRYVDDASGATIATSPADRDPRAPEITCRVLAGARPASEAVPEIVSRLGIDVKPIAVDDAVEVRWLRACLWPHDAERRARFDAAVAIARAQHWPLTASTDAAAAIDDWLATLPGDATPVVFNSWVLAYFDKPLLGDHVRRLLAAVARRGVVWISAENPTLSRAWWADMPTSEGEQLANATSWTLARPDGHGGVAWKLAATSQAHGRWMQWEA